MNRKGFTLIELLVVIAIIGLLSTLAVVALSGARQRSRDSKRLSDLKQIQTALELYYMQNNNYPVAATAVTLGVAASSYQCLNASGWGAAGCGSPYMGLVPKDPGSNSYTYTSTDGSTYRIDASLEGTVSGLGPNGINATPAGIQ